jgi:polar amino acid transport system substrate-binding protein
VLHCRTIDVARARHDAHSWAVIARAPPGMAFLLVGLAGLAAAAGARADPPGTLRVAVNEANGRPFALYGRDGEFEGGLARDVIDPLAAGLGLRAQYLNLPRARVETWLHDGRLDAACFLAPDWVAEPQRFRWSPVLFRIRQVVVSPPGAAAVAAPQALFGRRLGTQLHYTYPELQPYFADGRIRRADAPTIDANIAKLARGRIDAFLYDDIAAPYAVRDGRLPPAARIDPLWAPDNPVYCAFNRTFAQKHPRWQGLLVAAVASGRVEAAIARYTGIRRARAHGAAP